MKKKILIIRAVSFQQLDKNLNAIVKGFPAGQFELYLLTHGHGMERAKTYKALSGIIDYRSRKNFSLFHLPRVLKKKSLKKENLFYEAVIVPVTNTSARGFLNVLALARRIPSHSIYICNLVSDIREISRTQIVLDMFKGTLFTIFAALLAVPLAIILIPPLLIGLLSRKVKAKQE